MRVRSFVSSLLAVFALSCPAALLAQFQAPTSEELKMTSDPKAPGAAAVYLYREEESDDKYHFHSYYERIKILTEKGKELATQTIPYEKGVFKISDIEGRTIHADGTVIPMKTKASDLMDVKSGTMQINKMVFTLPDVEVGSILEFRFTLGYEDNMLVSPTWEIQQPYFVHKAHYFFAPSTSSYITNRRGDVLSRLMYSLRTTSDAKVVRDGQGRYTFDITDVPAIPEEDWMPPMNVLKWKVEFYYTSAYSGEDFWANAGKRWAKDTDRFINPSGEIKKTAAGLVAPGDSDLDKAKKIYAAVMKLDNTAFSRTKSETERKAENVKAIKDVEDVWKQQAGSPDDLALLYVALARAAGLKAWPMQVVNRDRAVFDPNYLSINQLDDYIAIVTIDGKDLYLDPGEKMCPFNQLHWKHADVTGLRISDKGAEKASTPPLAYTVTAMLRTADLTIDETGEVKGTARMIMGGPEALRWRQTMLRNDEEEVKKRFNKRMREQFPEGLEATLDHFSFGDDYNSRLLAVLNVKGSMGTVTGKRVFLPGLFFESRTKHPFAAQETRLTPIDVQYAKMFQDQVTYHLPAGMVAESVPQSASISWESRSLLKISAVSKPGSITVQRVFGHNYSVLDSKDYPDLHAFYQKIAAADQQQVVLVHDAAAKGN